MLQWTLGGLLAQTKPHTVLLCIQYHVVFNELLKETRHGSHVIVSKCILNYRIVINYVTA